MSEEADSRYVFVRTPEGQVCAGPNHGNSEAQPKGIRRWHAGEALSLTQTGPDGSAHNVFCGPSCLCDWHGMFAAALASVDVDDEPPGRFILTWISLGSTTVGDYATWSELTEHVGMYQKRLLDLGHI